jgi:uncharacterized protein (TIGR02270 family)
MLSLVRKPVLAVVHEHTEDAAVLKNTRAHLVRAPHVKLHHLRRLDDRLAAHLDGLAVAGEDASALSMAALERPGSGEMFTATVGAIEARDAPRLDKLLAIAEATPDSRSGLISAFGWVSAPTLRGITKTLLDSPNAFRRQVGLAACAMHQVDPGAVLVAALKDDDAALRARALRVAGERGYVVLLPDCLSAMADADPQCAFEAMRAAVLLGERTASLAALQAVAAGPGPWRARALALVLKLQTPASNHAELKALSQDVASVRLLISAIGVAGDTHYLPWLIQQMQDLKLTRLAGESFSRITGLDLADLDLDRKPPENFEPGPNDDPDDSNVAMDEDDSLPWPDADKITAWWHANGPRFASGTRYFMGEPPSPAHCLSVLKTGFQRQRIAAAEYLCLMKPGTPLFNTAAPAWRQERLLAQMGA